MCSTCETHMHTRSYKKWENPKNNSSSVNLLHLGRLVSGPFDFLERGKVVIVAQTLIVIINAQTKFDHAVDASSELCGFIEVETRGEQGGVKEKPNEVFHGFVRFVRGSLLLQF